MKKFTYLILLVSLSAAVQAQTQTQEHIEAQVFYSLGSASLDSGIKDNRVTLDKFIEMLYKYQEDSLTTIERVEISSYTSPEGGRKLNDALAVERTNSVLNYLKRKITLPDSLYKINNIGIAWERLRVMVAQSDMPQRERVIHIIDNTPEETWRRVKPTDRWHTLVDSRNKQLMDLAQGVPYRYMMKEFFPDLRSTSVVSLYIKREAKPEPVTLVDKVQTEIITSDSLSSDKAASTVQTEQAVVPTIDTLLELGQTKELYTKPLFAVKTNLLFLAALMPNVEFEVPIGNRWSIAGDWMFPWWITDDNANALQVLSGNLEGRYWFGERENRPQLTGWFAGFYAGGGLYDLQWRDNGYQGEFFIAAGLSGGYAHTINRSGSLRMEYSLGIGYLKTDYRYYEGMEDNKYLVWQHDGNYTWIGPTRAKISLVWMLNKKGGKR